jgi:hypothetical protein
MAKTLRKVHCGSPLRTNASINRDAAVKCFQAGMTVEQIATAWPEVFKVTIENGVAKLGQRYDYEIADGSGRYETKRMILSKSVRDTIAAFKRSRS